MELTRLDREILAFERRMYVRPGAKETAIARTFAMTSTRYAQHLNRVIDQPAALAHDPVTVRRLQRLRDARVARRAG